MGDVVIAGVQHDSVGVVRPHNFIGKKNDIGKGGATESPVKDRQVWKEFF